MKRAKWYFQVWSGIFEHREQLGDARWEFDWCILRTTEEIRIVAERPEDEVWGLIYAGKPVPLAKIAQETHTTLRTVKRHFRILRQGGYIFTLSRGRFGLQIALRKSKKWPRKTPKFLPFATIEAALDARFESNSKVPKVARQDAANSARGGTNN